MSLTEIRERLADVIDNAIPELYVYPNVVGVTQVPGVVVVPAEQTGSFEESMSSTAARWLFDLFVMVPYTEMNSNQRKLDELIDPSSPTSVPAVIRANPTLDNTVMFTHVIGVRDYGGKFGASQVDHIGAVVQVEVRTCLYD